MLYGGNAVTRRYAHCTGNGRRVSTSASIGSWPRFAAFSVDNYWHGSKYCRRRMYGASARRRRAMPTYDPIVEAYMPNLENLKKQAKLILRWHRERHHPVAVQIRRLLPRFLNMSDLEILAASFQLSDAQEMVARQHGFDSWQTLKTGLSTAPRKLKSLPSKATIVGAEPQLLVTDIKRSCEFFGEKLGFSLVFRYGDPPYYAQVRRDAARLNLRCVEAPVIESAVRDREELLSASMTVATAAEIKLLFLEFQSAGVTFRQKLKKQPWGAKNFVVKDPDGNLLLFAGPAD
ncbi:MAG TPA: VOC family protein [Candidatus Acidoferrales bacterium]|nr:VOC family protein [Candidatus Acidoferrales bacterium]